MDDYDKKQFAEIMIALSENFSSQISKLGLELRFDVLKQYSVSDIKKAAMYILRTRKYTTLPTVADFVDVLEGNIEDQAEVQVSLLLTAIKNIGVNPQPQFSDRITHDIVFNRIGWSKIRLSLSKDIPYVINSFRKIYTSYAKIAAGTLSAPQELKHLIPQPVRQISETRGGVTC